MRPHGLNSTIVENVGRVGNVKALWSLQIQNFFTSQLLSWENSPMWPHGLNSTIREMQVELVPNISA